MRASPGASEAVAAALPQRDPSGRAAVRLTGVSKTFGAVDAVSDVDLALPPASLTSLLGPSGCGKTTLLRLIAGLELPTRGEIEIKGRPVNHIPIQHRNIGLVFQNYALFPHKTVHDNIAFGLRHRGVDAASAAAKVRRALDMVRLPGLGDRLPSQLSGGQQQRVALARAVVFEPDVLLLDEPLSALDANLRDQMRLEIKLIQRDLGLTTVLVTHDQQEALAMSDRIVVMNHGKVQQVGAPAEIYRQPRNRFVAGFLGQANTLLGQVVAVAGSAWRVRLGGSALTLAAANAPAGPAVGDQVDIVIRASDIAIQTAADARRPDQLAGRIEDASYLGDAVLYVIDLGDCKLKASCRIDGSATGADAAMLPPGTAVFVGIPAEACLLLPAGWDAR